MIQALKSAGSQSCIKYDPDLFALRIDSGGVALLHNHRNEFLRVKPEDRDTFLMHRAKGIVAAGAVPASFAEARGDLIPRIRADFFWSNFSLHLRSKGEESVADRSRLYTDGLAIELCLDTPHNIHTINPKTLESWGVDWSDAVSIATQNLSSHHHRPFSSPHPGVFQSPYADNHDASRITMIDEILLLKTKGRPVALIPDRDTLLVVGEDDSAGLVFAAEKAGDVWTTSTRRVSGAAFRLEAGHWVPFLPDETSDAYPALRELRLRALTGAYRDQGESINRIQERDKAGAFVATCKLIKVEGELKTWSVLTNGVPTLLPQTDCVTFIDTDLPEGQRTLGTVPWKILFCVLGASMKRHELHPPRFEIIEFPTEKQLDAMGIQSRR